MSNAFQSKEQSDRLQLCIQLYLEDAPLDRLREVLVFTRRINDKKRKEEKNDRRNIT